MDIINKYGFYRSLEPNNCFPQTAWKLDNTMEITDNELLIDVSVINIQSISFRQILEETNGEEELIKEKILLIVNERGKLHNPITGTGGMLYGRVQKIGESYSNRNNIEIGDEIVALVSLSAIPLKIVEIINVDIAFTQITLKGQAIIFDSSYIVKKPKNIPLKIIMKALSESGAVAKTFDIVQPNQNVVVLDVYTKLGVMCAFAAREKIGRTGNLVGVSSLKQNRESLLDCEVFDEVLTYDIYNPLEFYNSYFKNNSLFDVVINCSEKPYTEPATLLCVKNKGTVFFADLSNDSNTASLISESISKEIKMIFHCGYIEKHSEVTLKLINKYSKLREFMDESFDISVNDIENDERSIKASLKSLAFENEKHYICESESMKKILRDALRVSKYNCTVLINGESGSGKELIAQVIYNNSKIKNKPFIKINCASIPEHLLESELFGYEKGAFTGANPKGKVGLWEKAGVLFLDEIGELPRTMQSKLLRVLQENEIYRVGGTVPIKVNARVIAATNKNLKEMILEGNFRRDLYYRLNVFPITVPPLRKRKEEIPSLIKLFVRDFNEKFNEHKYIEESAIEYLKEYKWTGNVRELENFIQRLLISIENNIGKIEDILSILQQNDTSINEIENFNSIIHCLENKNFKETLEEVEKKLLIHYKKKYKTTRKIASASGMTQSTISRKMIKYKI